MPRIVQFRPLLAKNGQQYTNICMHVQAPNSMHACMKNNLRMHANNRQIIAIYGAYSTARRCLGVRSMHQSNEHAWAARFRGGENVNGPMHAFYLVPARACTFCMQTYVHTSKHDGLALDFNITLPPNTFQELAEPLVYIYIHIYIYIYTRGSANT